MPLPSRKLPPGVRLFYVECECGEEFKAYVDVEAGQRAARGGLLIQLSGRCPACQLQLEDLRPLPEYSRG